MTPALLEHLTVEEREAWKLAQEATPGPWTVNDHADDEQCFYIEPGVASVFTDYGDPDEENAAFIAALRTALPAALLALAEARKERDEARLALRELCAQVEKSNAVDDHGHPLKNLKVLKDARVLLDAAAHAAKEEM